MSATFRDPVIVGCLCAFKASSGIMAGKIFSAKPIPGAVLAKIQASPPQTPLSPAPAAVAAVAGNTRQPTLTVPTDDLAEAKKVQSEIERNMAGADSQEAAEKTRVLENYRSQNTPVAIAAPAAPASSVPTPLATRQLALVRIQTQVLNQKRRPAGGGKEWLIGKSDKADFAELENVLKLAESEDVIVLDEGTHELDTSQLSLEKISFKGKNKSKLYLRHTSFSTKIKGVDFEDLELAFLQVKDDFVFFRNITMKFARVRIDNKQLTLNFSGRSEITFEGAHLAGTALRFSGETKSSIEGTYFERSTNVVSLSDDAQVVVRKSQFFSFSNVAISSDSDRARLTAEDIRVAHGAYAFWGKFSHTSEIKNSSFSDLKEFTLSDTVVKCTVCEKFNIAR